MNIKDILDKHAAWLRGEPEGVKADLPGANLSKANLSGANLSKANLSGADLSGAHLSKANLYEADLSGADLSGAHLSGANLTGAHLSWAKLLRTNLSGAHLSWAKLLGTNLSGAHLTGANLLEANLSRANLSGANLSKALNIDTLSWDSNTAFYPLQCPETGTYTAYKKANNLIVELEIPYDALRSSATSRTCRASKAKVISITDLAGRPAGDRVLSDYAYSPKIEYIVGQTIEIPNFDTNRWHECAPGIHHYITREEAVKHEN
ncbi:pentapeptide repeat-containing protein [Anaerotruncus colihominis]|uniref:pentapeptide repeat-containing protein n=1 Tax=Anaerotruncus colihominis TaxID=169435 RepID=UPI00210E850B|nr:pentapeptide repeat-containing protein [Anaerotruncus colihominis]MCQ4735453.1 pentapeptide repeat-containing protein [Anaerotruncus colihominis]